MTIKYDKTEFYAEGTHGGKNSKPVFCITTGEVFASVLDAAKAHHASKSTMSYAVTGRTKTCKGKTYCFVSDLPKHLDKISEGIQMHSKKAMAYDAIIARQEAIKSAKQKFAKYATEYAKLEQQLADTKILMLKAEKELDNLERGRN